jgi:hypothetical protein
MTLSGHVPKTLSASITFDRQYSWCEVEQMPKFAKRLQRPSRALPPPQLVDAFESDAATHSGDWIDEEAYTRHRRNTKRASGIPSPA